MFPFWEPILSPLVLATRPKRILEIGALRGETTVGLLDALDPDTELHVIDPLPQFDPAAHEARFPGRYVFHRDLSLNVLSDLEPVDVALIDGDHNWYTVINELRAIKAVSDQANQPLPLLILHDVAWPYGKRDLYYEPSQIPEEHRQPWARRGMTPGRASLLPGGGMNISLANAVKEGGERNGVGTAMRDFLAEQDVPTRLVEIPIYYGLAIIAEQRFLDTHPEVEKILDELESPDGTADLLRLSESIRLSEVVFTHNVDRMRDERSEAATRRYLDLLQGSLLDRHYIENEDRIDYLLGCIARGTEPDRDQLRSPSNGRPSDMRKLEHARRSGIPASDDTPGHFSLAPMGGQQLAALDSALFDLGEEGIDGDLVDVGCGRGGAGIYMRGFLEARERAGSVWVADRFLSAPPGDVRPISETGTADLWPSLTEVSTAFDRFDLLDDRVRFLSGEPASTLAESPLVSIALMRIGSSATDDVIDVVRAVGTRIVPGGIIMVEQVDPTLRADLDAVFDAVDMVDAGSLGWSGNAWKRRDPQTAIGNDAPVAVAANEQQETIDLSVVVVFHNMRREAERTLHSLSREYQRGLDDVRYEVIAVDNGSEAGERLTTEFVESFGPEFSLIDMGADAPASPIPGLNRAVDASRGESVAMMIDGAHVLSPGVLREGLRGLRAYEPAIVATQHWYVGPGQQPEVISQGYDQATEDGLFETINWPADGYRLFDISHFIGDRDWLDGMLESNCLFAPREILDQVGAFDSAFDAPGGGFANLEIYERLGSHPGAALATILGEGTFHQIHGGATTNDSVVDNRREKTVAYAEQYREVRGRGIRGPARPIQYVGGFQTNSARRTRSRRVTASAFQETVRGTGTDGVPAEPIPIPDEVATGFTEAYWNSLAWKELSWLGLPTGSAATDLLAYQQLIHSVRPDHVVVLHRRDAAVAEFAASVCQLIGHGEVLAVGPGQPTETDPPHLVRIDGNAIDPDIFAEVRRHVGETPRCLVIFGSGHGAQRVRAEFDLYSSLVFPGSFAIVENTVVNGRPVWPGFGPGPHEAIRRIISEHTEFVQDTTIERFGLTFNSGGYLRRAQPK